jgi:diguanylate cyclase (GGDEF)-like protein
VLTYVVSQLAFGARGDDAWQVVGVAATDLALGVLLLRIRLTTEREVNERTDDLAAANDRLELLNGTDPLTGLANRRHLEQALAGEWALCLATERPVSVMMIDIDHFKLYNDHYGHLEGDRCLQAVAAELTASARGADVVARYGGEEFSIVLPDADLDVARQVAERVRLNVACLQVEHATSPSGFVTVSIGVASAVPGHDGLAEDLVRNADRYLYEAKRNGRNRIAALTAPAQG